MSVPEIGSLDILLRYLILALPLLVLIVLFFLLANSRRSQVEQGTAEDAALPDESAPRSSKAPLTAVTLIQAPPALTPKEARAEAERLEIEINDAENRDATEGLAALYLAQGKARLIEGDEPAALNAFRSAAGLAALHREQRVHAESRLELAEAAIRQGDPTTACEHWQMARMAFLADDARAEGENVDRRMLANGCPTDWVLTDF